MGKPKPKTKKEKKEKKGKAKAYAHLSKHRCPRCRQLMRPDGTRENGRIKRWQCPAPICRKRAETVGEEV